MRFLNIIQPSPKFRIVLCRQVNGRGKVLVPNVKTVRGWNRAESEVGMLNAHLGLKDRCGFTLKEGDLYFVYDDVRGRVESNIHEEI